MNADSAVKPYEREVSRAHKGYLVFLLDQSGSMEEPIAGSANRKCDEVALVINRLLHEACLKSTKEKGLLDYLDISVIGYRTDNVGTPIVESAFAGNLMGRESVPITELEPNIARVDVVKKKVSNEDTGEIEELPFDQAVWVDAFAQNGTPMLSALRRIYELVENWIAQPSPRGQESFPPIVIHISDGESSEVGDPIQYADPIRELRTKYGNVLLFNCHLSMTPGDQCVFPNSIEQLPDEFARTLFRMSSELPPPFLQTAKKDGFPVENGARGMSFNGDLVSLIKFIDIGTRVALK